MRRARPVRGAPVQPPRGGAGPPVVAPVLSDVTLSAALGSVGDTLTATPVYSTAGTAPVVATYQWTRGGVDISGATSSTYTLAGVDEGAAIRCRCSATGPGGSTGPVTSSGLCQVRVYGLGRAAIGDDILRTTANVANQPHMTFLHYGSLSAVGTRGDLIQWGRDAQLGSFDVGAALQVNPTNFDTLSFAVARAASTGVAVAEVAIPGGNAVDGTARLHWGTIGAAGLTAIAGVGGTAGTPQAITGGVDTGTGTYATVLSRIFYPDQFSAAGPSSILAVLSRAWTDTEAAALVGAADPRAALLDFLVVEEALGNVLWWPAPVLTETDGSIITVASETEDLAGVQTNLLTAGAARLTAEGP
jgi:hypothetical protein